MKKILIVLAILTLLAMAGCATSLKDLSTNPEKYLGKKVTVEGAASNVLKIGKLSGFKISQGDYSIAVSSENLPGEGKQVKVTGIVMKDSLFGYYILAEKLSFK